MKTTFPKRSISVHTRRRALLLTAFALVLVTISSAFGQSSRTLSANVRGQIASLFAAKQTYSASERKMSSDLVFRTRAATGKPLGIPSDLINVTAAKPSSRIEVEIGARVSPRLLVVVGAHGGQVKAFSDKYQRIDATVPLSAVPAIAADSEVQWIRESLPPMFNVGALTSQGYISHQVNQVLTATGAGVKVGVLSDSASSARVTALITSGDLGATTTVLPGQGGSGNDEGAAMMEIVQDMAPEAQLYFATANGGQTVMANNIAALSAAGCSIIVDDVTYYAEGAFQDGVVAQAVTTFVNSGGLYFSSAANSGNLTNGTSGTWEGDFLDGGSISGVIATAGESGQVHNFGTSGSPQTYDPLTATSSVITLKWSDPLAASTNDYDLFVLNSTGTTVKAFSASVQNGTQDPFEQVSSSPSPFSVGDQVVVVKFSGSARALRVDTNRGQLGIATSGSTFGHNAGSDTIGVAAAYWNQAGNGIHAFIGTDVIEPFSSDGPRRLFYSANGTAITPGNVLFATGGGVTLQQPVLTAADGGVTKTPNFLPFYGTSAAAPHAAGIAALIKSAAPTLTNAQIRNVMTTTALDIMGAGTDRDSGFGVIRAKSAVDAATGP